MKKLLVGLCTMFAGAASATTVNIDWLMDDQTYAQTTCETGGNFALPTPTPTKYGYHFVGWQQNDAVGSWSQSGTPTPTNPIYPTFKQFGNTVLRAVGTGDYIVADSYDPTTGKITRRVGVKVLDGTETWEYGALFNGYRTNLSNYAQDVGGYCTHFQVLQANSQSVVSVRIAYGLRVQAVINDYPTTQDWTDWLKAQYNAGTPVIIVYPLAEPVEENYNAQ